MNEFLWGGATASYQCEGGWKEGGHTSYRFSLAWPRIIKNLDGEINQEGIDFYNELINTCLENGITPFITGICRSIWKNWEAG